MAGGAGNAYPNYQLPFTGQERISFDTRLAGGAAPQTASIPISALGAIGLGATQAVVDAGQPLAFDVSQTGQYAVTLTGANRVVSFVNPTPGQEVFLYVTQDGTGSRTITWTNVMWPGGTPPVLSTGAGALDVLRFHWSAALGKWIGELVGKAYA